MKNTTHTTHMAKQVQAMQAGKALPDGYLYPYHCVEEQGERAHSTEKAIVCGDTKSPAEALEHIKQSIGLLGKAAFEGVEEYVELLQDVFIARLTALLQEKGIVLEEKITLSLSRHNTLFLECATDEDALLAALGDDEELVICLRKLRESALLAHGLQYFMAAQELIIPETMPQYKVCAKGELSHFYLKHG